MKFLISTEPAWVLRPNPLILKGGICPTAVHYVYIGRRNDNNADDADDEINPLWEYLQKYTM